METRSKNAQVFLRDARGIELPHMTLNKTGLVLASLDKPGRVVIDLRTAELTRLTATLDGETVYESEAMLRPGNHEIRSAKLEVTPATGTPQLPAADEPTIDNDDAYLASLGIEPDPKPVRMDRLYTGAPGGVLQLRIGYFVLDDGEAVKEREFDSDVLTFKINGAEDFALAIAANAHRLEFAEDPDAAHQGPICGTCNLTGHHHH